MCVCVSVYKEDVLAKVRHHLTESTHHWGMDILVMETLLGACAADESIVFDPSVPPVTRYFRIEGFSDIVASLV